MKPKSDIMTSPPPVSEHLQCIRMIPFQFDF
jgi:hypothetical protein